MCDKAISKNLFTLKYCLGKYKNLEICDKVADAFLPSLKCVSDLFDTKQMIKTLEHLIIIYSLMMISSLLMKILTMSHFLLIKWPSLE